MKNGASQRRLGIFFLALCLMAAFGASASLATGGSPYANQFTLFESGQVRPLALSPDGDYLYAVNTPDNRLEVFQVNPSSAVAGPDLGRLGPRRPRAGGGRGAQPPRGVGGQPPVRQRQRGRRHLAAQPLGGGDPPGRRRAAGHRLRRSAAQPGLRHRRPPRPEQPQRPAADHPRYRPRRRLGLR